MSSFWGALSLIDVLQENASKFLNKISSSKINVFNENDEQVLTLHEEKEFMQLINQFLSLPYRSIKNNHDKSNNNLNILQECCIEIYLSEASNMSKDDVVQIVNSLNNVLINEIGIHMSDMGFWKDGLYYGNRLPYLIGQIENIRNKALPLLKKAKHKLKLFDFYGKTSGKIKHYPSKDLIKEDKDQLEKAILKNQSAKEASIKSSDSSLQEIKNFFIYNMYFKDSFPQDINSSGARIRELIVGFVDRDMYPKDEFDKFWQDLDLRSIIVGSDNDNDNIINNIIEALDRIAKQSLVSIDQSILMIEMLRRSGATVDTKKEIAFLSASLEEVNKKAEICKSILSFLTNHVKSISSNFDEKDKSYQAIQKGYEKQLKKLEENITASKDVLKKVVNIEDLRKELKELAELEESIHQNRDSISVSIQSLIAEKDQIGKLGETDQNISNEGIKKKEKDTLEQIKILNAQKQNQIKGIKKRIRSIKKSIQEIKSAQISLAEDPKKLKELISSIENIKSAIQNRSLSYLLHNTRCQHYEARALHKNDQNLHDLYNAVLEIEKNFTLELEYSSSVMRYRHSVNNPEAISTVSEDDDKEEKAGIILRSEEEKQNLLDLSKKISIPPDIEFFMNHKFIKRFLFINSLKVSDKLEELHMLQSTICNFTSWIKVCYGKNGPGRNFAEIFYKKIRSEQLMHFFSKESSSRIVQDEYRLNKVLDCMRKYATFCYEFLLNKLDAGLDNKDIAQELPENLAQIEGAKKLLHRTSIDITNLVKNKEEGFSLIFSWNHPHWQKPGEQNQQLRYRNSTNEDYRVVSDIENSEEIIHHSIKELGRIIDSCDKKEAAESSIAYSEILALQHLRRIFKDFHKIIKEVSEKDFSYIMSRDIFHEYGLQKPYDVLIKNSILIDSYIQNIGDLFSREPLCSKEIENYQQYKTLRDLLFYAPDYRINKGHSCFSNQGNISNILSIVKDRGVEIEATLKELFNHTLDSAVASGKISDGQLLEIKSIFDESITEDLKSASSPSSAVLQPAANSSRSSDIDQSPNR